MFTKFFVIAGLASGVLLCSSVDGNAENATLQNAAYSTEAVDAAPSASKAVKKRVSFHVPKKDRMIYVDQRDAPAGYVNTRSFTIQTAETTQADTPDAATDWLKVTGTRVNLRSGPGTGNAVVGSLTRGTRAIALRQHDNGWVELEVPELGLSGFMSGKFLVAQN